MTKEQCDCTSICGDDQRVWRGKVSMCQDRYQQIHFMNQPKPDWKYQLDLAEAKLAESTENFSNPPVSGELKHPIQPIILDKHGVARFKENKIVTFLLENGNHDMNSLTLHDFSDGDREQFAQLIGYSLAGFAELSYVSDETYYAASIKKPG